MNAQVPFRALKGDGTDAWPSTHLRAALAEHPPTDKAMRCVLLTTGSMNPVHRGHTNMFEHAKHSSAYTCC